MWRFGSRQFFKRILCAITAGALTACSISGCGGENGENGGMTETQGYKSYHISSIEDVQTVFSMNQSGEDLIVLGQNAGGDMMKYVSSDAGVTFTGSKVDIELDTSTTSVWEATLDQDGKVVAGCVTANDEGTITGCQIWREADQSMTPVSVSKIGEMCAAADGSLYLYDGTAIGKYTWNDAEITSNYRIEADGIIDYIEQEDEVLVLTEKELTRYDSATGKKINADQNLTDALADEIAQTADEKGKEAGNCHKVMRLSEDGELILALKNGIYTYDLDSGLTTKLVGDSEGTTSEDETTANAWLDDGTVLYDFAVSGDPKNIIVLCSGTGHLQIMGYSTTAMKVAQTATEQSESTEEVEPAEITVYSLQDWSDGSWSYTMDIINVFKRKYPDITVNYEVGMPDGNGITASDAIKALNTELLAGNGPDVILMDGLDVQRYVDAGLLYDITDVYSDILEENPSCLTNVVSAYKTDQGIYAIPSAAKGGTAVIAPESEIDQITDLASLTEYIQNEEEPDVWNDLNLCGWEPLFELWYPVYASDIVSLEGVYNEENLRTFLSEIKDLNDLLLSRTTEEELAEAQTIWDESEVIQYLNSSTNALFLRKYTGHSIGLQWLNGVNVETFYSLAIAKVDGETTTYNEDLREKAMKSKTGTPFIPSFICSVNAASEEKETASLFIKEMFRADVQELMTASYFPVNMDAWWSTVKDATTDGGGFSTNEETPFTLGHKISYDWYYALNQHFTEAKELVESFDTISNSNAEIEEMIKSGMQAYCEGEKTLDGAVSDIGQALKLYLSE